MSDKIKLAAIGAQYRLTEEQAKGLAERMPQTGALQVIDDEPLCMAKRIEELEAQVRVMVGLLREARKYVTALGKPDDEVSAVQMTVSRIDALLASIDADLAGKMPSTDSVAGVDWSSFPRWLIDHHEGDTITEEMFLFALADMLASTPSPDNAK